MSNVKDASEKISPFAGKRATLEMLVDVPRLVTAYYTDVPDPSVPKQRVAFGTSGHRGSAFEDTFNEWHVLAISQAICDYRKRQGIGARCSSASTRMRCLCRRAPVRSKCWRPTVWTSCSR